MLIRPRGFYLRKRTEECANSHSGGFHSFELVERIGK